MKNPCLYIDGFEFLIVRVPESPFVLNECIKLFIGDSRAIVVVCQEIHGRTHSLLVQIFCRNTSDVPFFYGSFRHQQLHFCRGHHYARIVAFKEIIGKFGFHLTGHGYCNGRIVDG